MKYPPRASVVNRLGLTAALALLLFVGAAGRMLDTNNGLAWGQQPQPRRFVIETATSEITVLLFKEGLFAGYAHDHVLVNNRLSGEILLHGTAGGAATATLSMPVDAFVVDAPEHRAREKLPSDISEEDRGKTRAEMMGPEQMDAAGHPRITAVVERIEGDWPLPTVWTTIAIRGGNKQFAIPVKAGIEGGSLTVSGEFNARHSDFGIDAFSAFMGTVAVKDGFKVRFRIEASESP